MASTTFTHAQAAHPPAPSALLSTLKGKSVLITGAASGIGEASTRAFVAAGAFVTIGDLSTARGEALASELGASNVSFLPCDTRSWADQAALFKQAVSRCGSVDIVFANAGISGSDPVFRDAADPSTGEPLPPDLAILETNLVGFMYTTRLALHYFARQAGGSDRCLIMTSSIAGYADHSGATQYSAAKFGTRGMMRSLRRVMPGLGARVNVIAPWFIETRIISGDALEKLQANKVPFARVEDAASAVLHLASDAKLNGRALTIVPREFAEHGYLDLEMDDDGGDDLVTELQKRLANVSIRVETK